MNESFSLSHNEEWITICEEKEDPRPPSVVGSVNTHDLFVPGNIIYLSFRRLISTLD